MIRHNKQPQITTEHRRIQTVEAQLIRRLVILSDGATNTGVHPRTLLETCRQSRVIIDAVAIGSLASGDYKAGELLLREICNATGGSLVHCPDVPSLIDSYRSLAAKKSVHPGTSSGLIEKIVLLLDRSPSMATSDYPPSRLEAAKVAVLTFYNAKRGLDPRDQVAVLQFDRGCQEIAPFGMSPEEVWRRVDTIHPGNATAIGVAIQHGLRSLQSG